MKGQKFLKITGIIMIVGGAVAIIAGVIAVLGVSALALLLGDAAGGTGLLYAASILCAISGVVQLIAGIVGVKHCKNSSAANSCIVWGFAVAILSIIGNILNVAGGNSLQITSLITGLILPALYIAGAVMNSKKS